MSILRFDVRVRSHKVEVLGVLDVLGRTFSEECSLDHKTPQEQRGISESVRLSDFRGAKREKDP